MEWSSSQCRNDQNLQSHGCYGHQGSKGDICQQSESVTAQNLNIALVADIDKRCYAGKRRKHQAQPHNLQMKPLSVL